MLLLRSALPAALLHNWVKPSAKGSAGRAAPTAVEADADAALEADADDAARGLAVVVLAVVRMAGDSGLFEDRLWQHLEARSRFVLGGA